MDKRLKKLWVKALRSGRYKQGKGALKEAGQYCCLGVLANIQGAKWTEAGNPYVGSVCIGKRNEETALLRPKFAGGLSTKTQGRLAMMNDGDYTSFGAKIPMSFKEIADYIEKKL